MASLLGSVSAESCSAAAKLRSAGRALPMLMCMALPHFTPSIYFCSIYVLLICSGATFIATEYGYGEFIDGLVVARTPNYGVVTDEEVSQPSFYQSILMPSRAQVHCRLLLAFMISSTTQRLLLSALSPQPLLSAPPSTSLSVFFLISTRYDFQS